VLASLHGSDAFAQTTSPSPSPSAEPAKPSYEAPVGHRQPRAADIPTEDRDNNRPPDQVDLEQRRLDRALRNICRGC